MSFAKNGVNQGVACTGLTGAFFPAFAQSAGTTMDFRIATTLTDNFAGFTQWR